MIMEAEKSHYLTSASWRSRCSSSLSPNALGLGLRLVVFGGEGRRRPMPQLKHSGREEEFSFPPPFCSLQASEG